MATVFIPTPLRRFTNNSSRLTLQATTIDELLGRLCLTYPDLRKHITTVDGGIPEFINIFVDNEDIRTIGNEKTPIDESSEVSIIPAIAGGSDGVLFSPGELARYNRHLMLPEMGIEGQKKLRQARVLIVGAGGLGCPLSLYLAAAGVGTIGLIDGDVVEDSNLQRQVLFCTGDIACPKVEAAARRLRTLNPYISVRTYPFFLTKENALEIMSEYDLVADGTDNFPVRYIINDTCVNLGLPMVYGSVFQFEGQVSVFNYKDEQGVNGPTYRDVYPSPPPTTMVPRSAEVGVLGVLPGIIGSLQALEVIKIITGIGEVLNGKLAIFDALDFSLRILNIRSKKAGIPFDMKGKTEETPVNAVV